MSTHAFPAGANQPIGPDGLRLSRTWPLASTVSPRIGHPDCELEALWPAAQSVIHGHVAGAGCYYSILKRWFDLALAILLLIVLAPLLLAIALTIRLKYGRPVLFPQNRIGAYGCPFMMYKFRTMIPDRRRYSIAVTGLDRRRSHKTKKDPRVTAFGRLLRRGSIDELPQLFNVIRGEMSLVGPRPELPEIVARYAPWQHQRHFVTPGITGWWQTHGRGDLPMHEHTELDLYYVDHRSFLLDLQILLRTIPAVLSRAGAF